MADNKLHYGVGCRIKDESVDLIYLGTGYGARPESDITGQCASILT